MRGERLEMEVQEESEEKGCSFAKLCFFLELERRNRQLCKVVSRTILPSKSPLPFSYQMCVRWVVARGFGVSCVGRIMCGSLCTETDGQPLIWAETLLQLHRSKPISLTHKFSPPPCWV